MLRRFPMIDGLRARIALALFAAVLFQFAGNEIIFAKVEETRMERGRSQRLADWLLFADEFVDIRPDAIQHMNDMWGSRLRVERQSREPALGNAAGRDVTQRILELQPGLAALDLRAFRNGEVLEGRVRLSDGDWLRFRSDDYYQNYSLSYHYTAALLLLIASVVLLALLFGRMIGRPLARIAEAAEQVGRDDPVPIAIEGPREVRQVAAAFDRMQARLLGHVSERVQSLAAMSHDLRTPLARLRLNASTVDDPETRAALEQDIDEMEAFVTSVLDYLRGDDPEQVQWADIASIAMTVVDEARDGGGDVDYSGPDRLEGYIRPLKLKRLLRNIVQNGVRHAGNAHLYLSDDDRQIILRIDDEGPGIPESKFEEVFEPFTRVEQSRSRSTGGAGLGLAIARQLSRRMGGTIVMQNRPKGGLSVIIGIPRLSDTG